MMPLENMSCYGRYAPCCSPCATTCPCPCPSPCTCDVPRRAARPITVRVSAVPPVINYQEVAQLAVVVEPAAVVDEPAAVA